MELIEPTLKDLNRINRTAFNYRRKNDCAAPTKILWSGLFIIYRPVTFDRMIIVLFTLIR